LCEQQQRNFDVAPRFPKKCRLGPQNGSGSFRTRKTAKNSELPKLPENCFEPVGNVGGHRYPPRSTVDTMLERSFDDRRIQTSTLMTANEATEEKDTVDADLKWIEQSIYDDDDDGEKPKEEDEDMDEDLNEDHFHAMEF
jgi:hypothetical protein